MITSITNEKIKNIIKLNTLKGRKEEGKFIVEGPHLVKEAKMCNILLEVYTTNNEIEGNLVSEAVMKKICNTATPTTVIGICKMFNNETKGHILALDRIQDPGNMGTLMRSAVSFGFDTILIGDGCVDIYNDKVIRSSQGAFFKLSYMKGNIIEELNKLTNYHIYNTNVAVGKNVCDVIKYDKMVLILGNEGSGVSKEINDCGYESLCIKLKNMESLNVGVAGSILMYELTK